MEGRFVSRVESEESVRVGHGAPRSAFFLSVSSSVSGGPCNRRVTVSHRSLAAGVVKCVKWTTHSRLLVPLALLRFAVVLASLRFASYSLRLLSVVFLSPLASLCSSCLRLLSAVFHSSLVSLRCHPRVAPPLRRLRFVPLSSSRQVARHTLHKSVHCIALHCVALHCVALHCIALHCIALHCIAFDYTFDYAFDHTFDHTLDST